MAIAEKALMEGGLGAALVPPQYGVGHKCPECGLAMKRIPSGEVACPNCGFNMKKAVGFVVDTIETKDAQWDIKEAARDDGVIGLYISGYASTWMKDRDDDTVARDAFDETLKSYLDDNPVLLLDHKREQVLGAITEAKTDDVGLAIKAFIPKPEADEEKWKITAYRDIKRGLRKALSIGGVFHRAAEKSARNLIQKVDLFEISNIAVPSNPKSLFRVIAEKGLSFIESKATAADAPAEDQEGADALVHSHAKIGGGSKSHKHPESGPGHRHPGLMPLPDGKTTIAAETKSRLASIKADDPDGDAGQLAQAIDAALDEAIEELQDGDAEQGLALVVAAEQTVDTLLELLNVADPDDPDEDDTGKGVSASRMVKAAVAYYGLKKGNEQALIDYWTEQMGNGQGEAGDFDKCVTALSGKADIDDPEALCAWIHKQATGAPPGHAPAEEDSKTEGRKSSIHPTTGGFSSMGEKVETKGAGSTTDEKGAAAEAKTVTLSAEEFEEYNRDIKAFREMKHQREVEETAESIAAQRLEREQKEAQAEQESKQAFANEVAQLVEAKLASSRSGRKYIVPNSERNAEMGGGGRKAERGPSMIDLLYRKAQGDPEARTELREMSMKAAAEYGEKALAEGGTSGFLVPPQYMQQGIAEYRIAAAKVRQLCTVIGGIGTNLVYIPRETGIATVGWTAEGAPKPSTDQTFGQLAVNIFTLAGIAKVSNQLLDDSSPAVDMLVRKDLGRLLGQAEDIAFLVGTGAGQPTGILNTTGILTGALGAATIADALATAIAAIQANYFGDPEAIVMNPRHLNVIRTAKDSNLRYIFEPSFFAGADPRNRAFMENDSQLGGGFRNMPSQGGPQGAVWGLPVYADANLPAPANLGNIIVGAFSEAYVLERTGVTIDVSSEAGTSFEQNQTWFRGEERLGFTAARQPTAFYAITTIP